MPAALNEAVVPETVQTDVVVEAKLTAKPELAVAESVSDVPAAWAGMAPKLMVCGPGFTVKLCVTGVAAA